MTGMLVIFFVGLDDLLNQAVAHYVLVGELYCRNASDPLEDPGRLNQAGPLVGQIDLGDVAGNDRFGILSQTGQQHLHLLGGGVLCLVEDDEGVVQRTPAHIGKRCDLDIAALKIALVILRPEHVKQRIIERPQIGIDLVLQISRQKSQLFTASTAGRVRIIRLISWARKARTAIATAR